MVRVLQCLNWYCFKTIQPSIKDRRNLELTACSKEQLLRFNNSPILPRAFRKTPLKAAPPPPRKLPRNAYLGQKQFGCMINK